MDEQLCPELDIGTRYEKKLVSRFGKGAGQLAIAQLGSSKHHYYGKEHELAYLDSKYTSSHL
jgi:hypothetical protein